MDWSEFDQDAIQLGKQVGIEVSNIEDLEEKLTEMNLILCLDVTDGSWIVVNSDNEILAKVE
jgi:hypothetical protein